MKKFLIGIFLFLSLPIVIGMIALFSYNYYIKTSTQHKKLEKDITSVFIGDSHIQKGINDSLIEGAVNMGNSSEALYYSFYKLKKILSLNPNIRKVYLGIGYHSFSNMYDEFIKGEYSTVTAPKYFFLLPISEQLRILIWNNKTLSPFYRKLVEYDLISFTEKSTPSYIGGFINNYRAHSAVKNTVEKRLQTHYFIDGKVRGFSSINLGHLLKIKSLCKAQNIELFLLSTPLHSYYRNAVPEVYKEHLKQVITENAFNHIDFSSIILNENAYIPDGDHVSYQGANIISNRLAKMQQTSVSSQ